MQNHVTFETSLRLKEAGFPQPTPEAGQFWWFVRYPDGTARKEVICVVIKGAMKPMDGDNLEGKQEFVFAPTSADILRELPVGFCIVNFGKFGFGAEFEKHEYIRDQNPAEAAAQAFLNLKAKQ